MDFSAFAKAVVDRQHKMLNFERAEKVAKGIAA